MERVGIFLIGDKAFYVLGTWLGGGVERMYFSKIPEGLG